MVTQTQLSNFGLFNARVPRYTSYPTAMHFAGGVGGQHTDEWIRALTPGTRISLYLHIPFCRRLCWFCACRTQGTSTAEPVRAYLDTLLTEVAMLGAILPSGVEIARIHWGGGTPTLLGPEMMAELNAATRALSTVAPDLEFSVEIDPNEIDAPRLDALAEAGMNRASIGVQDFDPEIQKIIGREQSFDLTAKVIKQLRARGIHSLNTDILYGLPTQTPKKITASVQKLLSLSPDRVALYGYAHVPWMARRQGMIPTDLLPSPQERLELFETAATLFTWDGYNAIGIDHFARPHDGLDMAQRTGRLRRNFQGYVDDTTPVLIGLGASAISRFPQGYAQNASSTAEYQKAVRAGQFATARGHRFAGDDLLRARMIEGLMCDFRISAPELQQSFDADPAELRGIFASVADKFPGVVSYDHEGFQILDCGRPLTRMIAHAFDAYEMSVGSHSIAV